MDFNNINAMKEKLAGLAGAQGLANDCNQAYQPSLVERVRMQANRAQRELIRSDRMRELADLLDKNPDTTRILELMGEFQG